MHTGDLDRLAVRVAPYAIRNSPYTESIGFLSECFIQDFKTKKQNTRRL